MELKIYFNTQFVILSDGKNTKISGEYYTCKNKSDVLFALSHIDNGENKNIVLLHDNFEELFEIFKSCFRYIEAAGGLVQNENDEILFMYRNDKWDLPKGKLDKSETPEIAAIREVQEETGLQKVSLVSYICSTWHTYEHKKGTVLKQTYWYAMTATKNQTIAPQLEEGITELKWILKQNVMEIMGNTYPSVIDVLGVR